MDATRVPRLVEIVLRCYPARWRRRHGAEAAEVAALLIRDGTPMVAVASSYLAGAMRERLAWRPGPRLTVMACALLVAVGALGVSAGLLASAAPARAASTTQAPGRAHCRPGPRVALPVVITALSRPQLISGEAGHARFC